MSNVSVSITANPSGFTAGMGQVSSSARGAAASVQSSMGKATGSVDTLSAASRKLIQAQRASADAAGQVRVAEARLADVRAKGGASTARQVQAEESLAKSKRRLVIAEKNVAAASNITGRATQLRAQARQQAADQEIKAAERVRIANAKGAKTSLFTAENQANLSQAGSSLQRYGAVGALAFGAVAKAAIDWESDFAGVTKTVDDNAAGYAVLEKDLRGLAKTLPETHTQIAATAEAAGQLGVARADIVPFVKTMVQLGDTTNLSSDEAATSLAQLINITGGAPGSVRELGDALVFLGNNGASTERDILQLGQRIAGAGTSVGLTQREILGFASAVASTGIEVEAGGTAMSQNFVAIDKAVRQGGKSLDIYAKTAGVSADEFAQAWGANPASATTQFVEGLAQVKKQGGSVQGVLESLGIKGQRAQDVYVRLAGATKTAGAQTDLLRQSLVDADRAQGALQAEADKRYQTSASKIKIALNSLTDSAITVGGSVLPVVSDLASGVASAAQKFEALPKGLQSFAVKGVAVTAAGALVGGSMLSAASNAIALGSALNGLAKSSPRVAGGLRGIAAAAGPVGVALLAVAAAGQVLDTYGAQVGGQEETQAALRKYVVEAGKAKDATLDLTTVFQGPNTVNGIAAGLGLDTASIKNFNQALQVTSAKGVPGFVFGLKGLYEKIQPGKQEMQRAAEAIGNVDTELGRLVTSGHGEDAAKVFQKIREENKNLQPDQLAEQFDTYGKALVKVASDAGVASLSQQELVDFMGGKVPESLAKAAAASPQVKKALADLGGGSKTAAQKAAELAQALEASLQQLYATPNAMLAASSAATQVESAFDAARAAVKENGKTLDLNTAKGRANQTALDGITAAANSNAQSLVRTGASQDAINAATDRARGKYADIARDMGLSSRAAKDLAKDLIKVPDAKNVRIVTTGAKISASQAAILNHELKGIPEEKRARIVTIAETQGAKAAQQAINEIKDKDVIVRSKGDLKGAKQVEAAMEALKDRLVLAKSRGDKSGADKIRAAMNALKDKDVIARSRGNLSGAKAVDKAMRSLRDRLVAAKSRGDTSGARAVQNAMNALRDRTVTARINTVKTVTSIKQSQPGSAGRKATGGKLDGPGTETSDDIPIMGSKNEWMIRAASSRKYGDAVMAAINAGTIPKDAFTPYGFAAGGKLGEPQYLAKGGKAKIPKTINYGEVARLVAFDPSPFADIQAALKDIAKAAKKGKKGLDDLKSATDALKSAQQSLADSVKAQAQTLSEPYLTKTNDLDDLLEGFRTGAKDLSGFRAQIAQLKKLGISDEVLKLITDKGAIAGSELAAQLLAGGKKLVDATDKAAGNLDAAAEGVGLTVLGKAKGKVKGHAAGGWITGVGTGTSDSNLIAASKGEFMVPEKPAKANRHYLEAITYGRRVVDRNLISPQYAYAGQGSRSESTVNMGDTILQGDFGTVDRALRRAQSHKRDQMTMMGLR